MNRLLVLLSCVLFLCAGCAGHHFTTESQESVSLFLSKPDALRVQFASSIDRYQLHDTRKNMLRFWEISRPLTPGSRYFYVVDGLVYIPDCRFKETDDFGSENCLYQP